MKINSYSKLLGDGSLPDAGWLCQEKTGQITTKAAMMEDMKLGLSQIFFLFFFSPSKQAQCNESTDMLTAPHH